ncbi:tyrosinase-like [Rhinophrynus dorsalis]
MVLLSAALGQFPRACTTKEALEGERCCPLWKDGSPCGVNSGRGDCPVGRGRLPLYRIYNDDRLNWPLYYYKFICQCFGNYSGYDCGDCKHGYFGDKCDRKKTVARREIRELSFLERKRFFSYLALAKTTKSKDFVVLTTGNRHYRDTYRFVDASIYDVFAWIHYYSMKPILRDSTFDGRTSYAHEGPAFPGWHRLGLLFFERQIQLLTGDEDFRLPYYDWRGEKNCSICTNDFLGDNDVQGYLDPESHFSFWRAICSGYFYLDAYCPVADKEYQMERLMRKPGADPNAGTLPSFQDVEDILKLEDFDTSPYDRTARKSFRNALEGFLSPSGDTLKRGMHNQVHVYMGGTIAQVPISANDPMFILHHCFIDKIFERWIQKYNGTSLLYPVNPIPGQGPWDPATPYFPLISNKDLLETSAMFGYDYSVYQEL